MQAQQMSLMDVLGAPECDFAIPLFQRSYTWQESQCDILVRDCLKAGEKGRQHFAGVMLYSREGDTRYLVDGQQRMTTLMLMLQAIAERLEARGGAVCGQNAADLRAMYLERGGKPKLRLNKQDNPAFEALLMGGQLPEFPSARIVGNLDFFRMRLDSDDCDIDMLWAGIQALSLIVVELDESDSAQNIFESLNSKGVQLTTADLCRNYLLVSLSNEDQERIYNEYWEPIENMFGDDPGSLRLNNAILGWLTIRFRRIRAKGDKQAFFVFKRYMQEEYEGTVEALLGELANFSKVWAENYRYHAVKDFKSAGNWATLGAKTLVDGIPLKPASKGVLEFYAKHFGIVPARQEESCR